MKRKILFPLISLLISSLLVVLAAELVLRIVQPDAEVPRWLVIHERYGHFQRANFQQTYRYQRTNVTWIARLNNLGLRGPDLDLNRVDDRRILFLGDSFTFGYGLDEEFIFPTLVGKSLNEKGGKPWTIINAGVGGWGTKQELLFATDHLPEFRPDVVVLTFCDNDLQDDVLFSKGKGQGLLADFPLKRWLRDHSRLYPIIFKALSPLLFRSALKGEYSETTVTLDKNRAATPPEEQSNPGGADLILTWTKHWPRTLELIRAFHDHLIEQNSNALMIIQQAQPLRSDVYVQLRQLDNGGSLRHLHLGLDVEGWSDRNVLLPYDPHWKPEMHELSAQRLVEIIDAHNRGGHAP